MVTLVVVAALAAAPGADAATAARCGHVADGFAYSIRASREDCRYARAVASAWVGAQGRCGVSYRGARRRRSCRVRGQRCTARRLYGMVAAVRCTASRGRDVAFRYSP